MGKDRTDRKRIEAQARDWFVLLTSGEATQADRAGFAAWRAADPRHHTVYDEIESLWEGAATLGRTEAAAALRRSVEPGFVESLSAKWTALTGAWPRPLMPVVGALAVALVALLLLRPFDLIGSVPDPQVLATQTAEVRDQTLPDGSIVTLGARSELAVAFTAKERRVALTSGQAFFDVQPDPSRPFVVMAAGTKVRVTGTKFDVRLGPEHVRVAVLEGEVRVAHASGSEPDVSDAAPQDAVRVLTAGQEVVAAHAGLLAPVRDVIAVPPGAWRRGRLTYKNATLLDVVSDANRYYDGEIVLAGEGLKDLRVTTSFDARQIDQMINTLSVALPVEVERLGTGRVIVRPTPQEG